MKELESVIKTQQKLPVSRATIINVMFSNNWVKDELIGVLKPYDLSLEQFNVLRILRGQKGQPINLQDIQERMVNKMSNTTRLVDKLILKGFVQRTICKNNRRKVEIEITDSGLKTLKEIDPKIDTAEQQITTNLNESELQQLNTLLIKLRTQN
ncbi:MAG: MarR family transcriptional regulator [Winogradskyella sp.]|nr:MarR family transcriptional regulator [Winogradskyella sp.]NNF85625.1 MarR family transcriptional regulator [Winogradskyella sp.]NNK40157.1 MarR family transcriptional regulator [Winogradskyella sp.]